MKEELIFLDYVGDNPRMRVLQYLIEGRDFDYTLTDLLNAGVSCGTLNTMVPKLLEVTSRKIGLRRRKNRKESRSSSISQKPDNPMDIYHML